MCYDAIADHASGISIDSSFATNRNEQLSQSMNCDGCSTDIVDVENIPKKPVLHLVALQGGEGVSFLGEAER